MQLQNYVNGKWVAGQGKPLKLCDPVTGEEIASAGSEGIDLNEALRYARQVGNPALQKMGYENRAKLLGKIAGVLTEHREKYYDIALKNSGNTLQDAKIDVDGGIGTLRYYGMIGKELGEGQYLSEPKMDQLARDKNFQAIHILTPLKGVAIHINAFNFPSWGLWEKAAVALLSGVPIFVKPATATSYLAYEMVKDVVAAGIMPEGSLSLICGGGHDLMNHVQSGDVVLFTGSAKTAVTLKSNPQVIKSNVRFNVEADSVNLALLGADVKEDTPLFDAFIKEIIREMTIKAGQKCTAIRRILVSEKRIDAVSEALKARLEKVVVGDPRTEGVRMGPLVNKSQQKSAFAGINLLQQEAEVVFGGDLDFTPSGHDGEKSCFVQPTLLRCDTPLKAEIIHEVEVFGPVATIMPYKKESEIWELAALGGGSLVASVFSNDDGFMERASFELAASHGRLLLVDEVIMGTHTGHGNVMPQSMHGGPGRAGGGEELGGLRGLSLYHQRTAIQSQTDRVKALRFKQQQKVVVEF